MKKLLLTGFGILPLLFLAQGVQAQSYSYDCLCLYSDPRGTCREYTCDAYRNSRRSYDYGRSCNDRYDDCGYNTYRPRYWNSYQYNDSGYNYNWYYNRYNSRASYYNYPTYNDYDRYGYPYYY
jgi:hypothetical protein